MAGTASHSADSLSGVHPGRDGSRRASPSLRTGIFCFRAQPSIPVLPRQQLEANRERRECAGARTDFERTFPESYRFEYGVEGGRLGNVESGVDS